MAATHVLRVRSDYSEHNVCRVVPHFHGIFLRVSYFQDHGVDAPPLHALQNGVDGPNGVYVYGSGGVFPTASYLAGNYWVDVGISTTSARVNQPPVVNAGPDQAILLPSVAFLSGTVTDDALPYSSLTVTWSIVSGPSPVTFSNASGLNTTATFSTPGVYSLRLTVSDGQLSSSDDVAITVNSCGAMVSGTVTPTANVTSSVGIAWAQFQLDGIDFGPQLTSAPYSITWDTTKVPNGCHTLTAFAEDDNGQQGTGLLSATVANP